MIKKIKNGIVYFEFENLSKTGIVNHCFSTRIGGVSMPPYDSMNLAYHMGDVQKDVDENFKRMANAINVDAKKIVMSTQTHSNRVEIVVNNSETPDGVDALITKGDNVLTTYYADCVPLLFVDPNKLVIANAHSGWRGTQLNIAKEVITKMNNKFDCNPGDILVGIGPCISQEFFEVGIEVANEFHRLLPNSSQFIMEKTKEKYHLDLAAIIKQTLLQQSIKDHHIEVSGLCTYKFPDLFFSHRRDENKRGNMAAMIALK